MAFACRLAVIAHAAFCILISAVPWCLLGCEPPSGTLIGTDPSPSPSPLPDPATRVESFGVSADVACGDCAKVWSVDAGGHSCGARIDWLQANGKPENEAKILVCIIEFPNECGACCGKEDKAAAPTPRPSSQDKYEHVGAPHVGEWGGKCRCPNGQIYDVGDNYDSCRSLACIGGEVVEACGENVISPSKAGWRVTCDTGTGPVVPSPAPPSGTDQCCTKCNGTYPFCSPVSGNCYHSKNKDYYQSCAVAPTPAPVVPSPAPPSGTDQCCSKCNGAYPFCSPVSGNCYHSKNKDYYQSCAVAPTPAPCSGPQCKDIKVMSYNTEYRDYNSRMGGYANKIKEIAPAIVGLQECQNRDGLASLAGYTPLYGTGSQNYILFDPSKVTRVSDGWMSIPRDDYAPRAITWGEFKLGDATVWFFNTHLPHNHNEAQSKTTHAKIARDFLDKRRELGAENSPTIVLGDMNSHASDFNQVPGGGFESNLQANGFTLAYTARGNPGHGAIDHILYSAAHWDHQNCGDTGTGGSDHTSITCGLVLK